MKQGRPSSPPVHESVEDQSLLASVAVLTQLIESDIFTAIDRHFARFMERLSGAPNPEVALAAALASRSQGHGNICLDLRTVAGTRFPDERAATTPRLELPTLEAWVSALRKAPVVGQPAEFKPLVLDASNRLYLHRYWQHESDLASSILRRAEDEADGIDETRLSDGLMRLFPATPGSTETDWQRVAASTAVRKKLAVISGGPGTGKTRTVVALLALLLEQSDAKPLRIALAAPTGKAATRLQEAINQWKAKLPCDGTVQARLPKESFTLHRLLGGSPDSAQVRHHADNPLPFDVVVVDEASMVDLAMMSKLFAATSPSARLVLLGDKDQLASVEAGAVLGEICAGAERHTTSPLRSVQRSSVAASSGASGSSMDPDDARSDIAAPGDEGSSPPLARCIVQLQKNYRFGAENGILALSHAINEGDAEHALNLLRVRPISTGARPILAADRHEQAPANSAIDNRQSAIEGVWAATLPSPAQLKAQLRPRVIEGFTEMLRAREPQAALLALNRFRLLCAVRRGPFGLESLNQLVEEILSEARLLSARQRWYAGRPVLVTRNDYNLRLYNGDVGIILPDTATGKPRAWFGAVGETPRSVPPVRLPEHETVFAMTVHKSQGSEFENVLLILPDRETPLLTRELLYTGVTRASRRVELWFDEAVFCAAVARRVERASGLGEALWGPQSR